MKLKLARYIDYGLGITLCFFISIAYKIEKFFAPRRNKIEEFPRKIMFLELSEMGAAILAYSAMKRVREIYPGAELYFCVFKENAESVHILDILPNKNVFTIRSESFWSLFIDTLKSLRKIRKEKIDIIIDMELFVRFTSILTYLSKAKLKVGFHKFSMEGLSRADIYTHKVMYNPYMHISKNFLSLVESVRSSLDLPLLKKQLDDEETTVPKIISGKQEKQRIWDKLKQINSQICEKNKIVILNPGIGEFLPLRKWPIENYLKLAEKLLRDKELFIILAGLEFRVKEQIKYADKLQFLSGLSRSINLIGKTKFDELINLYNISSLLITHDSGIANIASLTNINMIVFFGPETPNLYSPLTQNKSIMYKHFACSPCFSAYNHRSSVCKNNLCLKAIKVDEVYKEACKYL